MNSFIVTKSLQSPVSKMLFPSIFTPNSLSNPVCLQCVRWRKKPRWLPVAKTKMFRVPQRIRHPKEEQEEVSRLFNNYRTSMKALRYYLSEKISSQTTAPEVIAEQLRLQEEDHERCMKLNNEWNEKVAEIRESRIAREAEEKRFKILEEVEKFQKAEEEELKRVELIVRAEKEKAKSFISPENIDEAIEKALNKPIDYNYCIDLSGNIYKGFRARPGVTEPDKKKFDDTIDDLISKSVSQ